MGLDSYEHIWYVWAAMKWDSVVTKHVWTVYIRVRIVKEEEKN